MAHSEQPIVSGSADHLRDERGSVAMGVIVGMGAATMLGIGISPIPRWAADFTAVIWASQNIHASDNIDGPHTSVEAQHILTKEIKMECRALDFYDASKSKVRVDTELTVGSKKMTVPEMYSDYTFERAASGKDPKSGKTIAAVMTCEKDGAAPAVQVAEQAPEDGSKFATTTVTINMANTATIATFPQVNVDRHDGSLFKALDGGSQSGSAALTTACLPLKLSLKLAGQDLDCGLLADKFTPQMTKDRETMGQKAAEQLVLQTIQKQGSKAAWETQTFPAFVDSIAKEAMQAGGAEAVKAIRIDVNGDQPNFDENDMFKDYKGSVLAKNGVGIKINGSKSKVSIKLGAPYKPEFYTSMHVGTDGLMQLTPVTGPTS